MKQLNVILMVLAMAAFAAGPALAKGGHHSSGHHSSGHHSGGHAHHSSSHAHSSDSHAHKSGSGHANHPAQTAKPSAAMKSKTRLHPQSKTAEPVHHPAKTVVAHHSASHTKGSATNSNRIAATPVTTTTAHRATRATTVSHRGSYYRRGYGRRYYHRHRRNYARNGRPSFTAGPDQVVGGNSGPQMVAPWATRIRAGSGRPVMGSPQFQVTNNSNTALFATPPSVSSTGTLSFTPAAGQAGTATVTLVLRSGNATSVPRTFHITVR